MGMEVYWQERRGGQRLVLLMEKGEELEIGGVRETLRGVDAFSKTTGYDPGHAQKGFPTLEAAKAFVESFRPWELYAVGQELEVDGIVRPPLGDTSLIRPTIASGGSHPQGHPQVEEAGNVPGLGSTDAAKLVLPGEHYPRKRWWEFWKKA